MNKAWQVIGLAGLVGLAVNAYADVQNIRLSGDIRVRGYYLVNTAGSGSRQDNIQDLLVSQRTRVSVEADLEDNILVVVTLKAEGLWGQDNQTDDVVDGSGAGTANDEDQEAINRNWDLGVAEAYVQFNEMFYAPLTLKVGRQYLHYGRGLIFSSIEQEYNFDAVRAVLDYYPLTIDVVLARLGENSLFSDINEENDVNLVFVNARYEFTDALLKNVEAYFGYVINNDSSMSTPSRVPPIANDSAGSPMIVGVRSDFNITENWEMWAEGAYEFGSATSGDNISAWLANVGGRLTLKDTEWTPAFNANYIFASGGGSDGHNNFRPWFDYVDGYNGYLFMPLLSNIHIFNLGASIKPSENTSFSVQGYYYMKVDKENPFASGSNRNVDFGGLGWVSGTNSRELGWEIDAIFGYDYSKDVRFQLVYAAFIPENGMHSDQPAQSVAHLVRGELTARF
ncbi:MAG: alginate export family protein [Verrucomicrobiae bacterium]|nr:alginate export family protein [Verrucomicrobiae bacterium]